MLRFCNEGAAWPSAPLLFALGAACPSNRRVSLVIRISWVWILLWPLTGNVSRQSRVQLLGHGWKKPAGCLPQAGVLNHTAISRKVVGRNVHASIPKDNMGYDQYIVLDDCSCRTYCCCFPLALANICPWPSVPFFQISLKNRALKTTHNTFRDSRVHFFRH